MCPKPGVEWFRPHVGSNSGIWLVVTPSISLRSLLTWPTYNSPVISPGSSAWTTAILTFWVLPGRGWKIEICQESLRLTAEGQTWVKRSFSWHYIHFWALAWYFDTVLDSIAAVIAHIACSGHDQYHTINVNDRSIIWILSKSQKCFSGNRRNQDRSVSTFEGFTGSWDVIQERRSRSSDCFIESVWSNFVYCKRNYGTDWKAFIKVYDFEIDDSSAKRSVRAFESNIGPTQGHFRTHIVQPRKVCAA